MGFSLPNIGKKIQDIEGSLQQAWGGAGHIAQQAPGFAFNNVVKPAAQTVGGALNPVPVIQEWSGNPAIRAQGAAALRQNNPIFRSGADYANAATNIVQGQNPTANLLKGTGEGVNLISSGLPLVGFGGRKLGEGAAKAIIRSSAQNAALGGVVGGSQGAITGNPMVALKSAGIGAAGGAALGAGGEALGQGVGHLAASPYLRNEVGAINPKDVAALKQSLDLNAAQVAKPAKVGSTIGPNLENPQVLPEIMAGNARSLANAQAGARAQEGIDRASTIKNNPIVSEVAKTAPGDYSHAVANSQQVSKPLETASGVFENAIKKLNSNEKAHFWKAVENPEGKYTPRLQNAIAAWRQGADMASANSHALGGTEGYVQNYARHPWDLSGWQEAEPGTVAGGKFSGISSTPRTHGTIAEGEAAGLKLGTDPLSEGRAYFKAAGSQLRKEALIQGLGQADSHIPVKPHTLDLGYGKTVPLSEEGMQAVRGLHKNVPSSNVAVKALRTANSAVKTSILSLGQFHTINIGALRAAPTLIGTGHPVAAAKGLYGMFRGAFGTGYADRVIGTALKDGTVEKAAKIGMPYGGGGYNVEGTFLKHGIGSRTVFGKQIPMMHDQVVRSIISDLEDSKVSLDSPQARQAGLAGAHLMGELNHELENISPKLKRSMTDWLLAGQFTPSKFKQLKTAVSPSAYTKGGVAGQYAATNVLSNVAASTAIIAGAGAILHQKSDDLRDMLLRGLIDPAVPTPLKDAKGNTIKLRLPGTDTSDVAKLLGITLVRNSDGHLDVNWSPKNMPTTVADFARARLSPFASAGVKLGTNTSFSGKTLYDPNAAPGTQAQQAATSIGVSDLPIGLQGVPYLGAVKSKLPQASQDILNAGSPGSNPVVKSIGSSFGLTPSTDKTVGKGQQNDQYFSALNDAKQGLNKRAQDALDIVTGGKKNPVTGKYEVDPTAYDTPTKANLLLQNPSALDHLNTLNQKLASQGQAIDPFYKLSKDQQQKALQIDRLDPLNPDKAQLIKQANWYSGYQKDRQGFFSSLPAGDPNKPKAPVQFAAPSASVQALASKYYALTDSAQKSQFIKNNPGIQQAFDATAKYDKEMRSARGLPELKGYPKASPALQAKLNHYNTLDKAGRSAYGKANPDVYNYFSQVSQFSLQNDATQARYVGNDFTPKGVSAIQSLGNQIYFNGGITGSKGQTIAPTGGVPGQTGASQSKSRSSGKSSIYSAIRQARRAARYGSRGEVGGEKVRAKVSRGGFGKVSFRTSKLSKHRVSRRVV